MGFTMLPQQRKTKNFGFSRLFLLVAALVLIATPALAATESQLRQQANELGQQVNEGEGELARLQQKTSTLEGKLAQLESEVAGLQAEIDQTTAKIAETEAKLAETEAELQRQEEIMNASIRMLYKRGRISTVELLAASENFTDFVNQQEYVERIKIRVHEAAEKVKQLKEELEDQKAELDELLATQTGKKRLLDAKRDEQAQLVSQARSAEFSYESYLDNLRDQQAEAEAELEDFLRSQRGNFVSQGRISQGDIVGYTGTTGSSTGNHLHLGIWDPNVGNFVEPVSSYGGQTLNFGFAWPYPTYWPVSRGFGCSAFRTSYPSSSCPSSAPWHHTGVDIAASGGVPVRAIGDGDIIFRSYWGTGGYAVMIEHDNGYVSYYLHLQPF